MRPDIHQIGGSGATSGQVPIWNPATGEWVPGNVPDAALTLYDAKGDLLVGTANDARARLAVGADGQVLTADSTQATGVKWAASASGFADPTTTKGDLIVHGASTIRLPVGADGQVLTADSTQVAGVKWGASGGGTTFAGCGAERTTAQSIGSGGSTFTALQFNAADLWDTDSIHDPATNSTRFTIPTGKGGRWRFEASVRFAANATGMRAVSFLLNGTALPGRYGGQYLNAVGGGNPSNFSTSTTLNLAAGAYVEVAVYQTSGAALNVDEAFAACQFLG